MGRGTVIELNRFMTKQYKSWFFSNLFSGLIYAITALGVAAGYMGGGLFLNLWVDIDKSEVDVDK